MLDDGNDENILTSTDTLKRKRLITCGFIFLISNVINMIIWSYIVH